MTNSKELIPSRDRRPRVPAELIEQRIYVIRGQKVMLDSDLGEIYRVTTGNLNLSVRRNQQRFPEDFMFRLTKDEANSLLLQFARSKGRGGRRSSPYAFTELGVAMLSSVLNSERAVQMNILIMRAFVKLRGLLATHKKLAARIEKLEAGQQEHGSAIKLVTQDVQGLMKSVKEGFEKLGVPSRRRSRIGFITDEKPAL